MVRQRGGLRGIAGLARCEHEADPAAEPPHGEVD